MQQPETGTTGCQAAGRNLLHRQRGVVSVEFAIIFPVLFLLLYAIITYALAFTAQQTLTLAAAEGARAGLRFQANDAQRLSAAKAAAETTAGWLKQRSASALSATSTKIACSYAPSLTCIRVDVKYINAGDSALVPPLLGILRLNPPSELKASATVQVTTF